MYEVKHPHSRFHTPHFINHIVISTLYFSFSVSSWVWVSSSLFLVLKIDKMYLVSLTCSKPECFLWNNIYVGTCHKDICWMLIIVKLISSSITCGAVTVSLFSVRHLRNHWPYGHLLIFILAITNPVMIIVCERGHLPFEFGMTPNGGRHTSAFGRRRANCTVFRQAAGI